MKFSAVLAFASVAFAAPSTSPETRGLMTTDVLSGDSAFDERSTENSQATAADVILDAVKTLEATTLANTNTINGAVAAVKNNVNAAAQLVVVINANYKAIGDAIKAAAASVVAVTSGAVGGITASAQGFTAAQIAQLSESVGRTVNAIKAIRATVDYTSGTLTPTLLAAVQTEMTAAQAAVTTLVTPLTAFAAEVGKLTPPGLIVNVIGLGNALISVTSIVSGLLASLGLPALDTAALTSLLNYITAINKLPSTPAAP